MNVIFMLVNQKNLLIDISNRLKKKNNLCFDRYKMYLYDFFFSFIQKS